MHAPNHVGDVVMALPALRRLAERHAGARVDCVARPHVAPLLAMAGLPFRTIVAERADWIRSAWGLRPERYDLAVLLAPSFRAAAFAWLAGARARRGTPTDARRWLLTEAAPRAEAPGEHRVGFYLRIVDPEWTGGEPPGPRLQVDEAAGREADALVDGAGPGPVLGVFPGSNAPARRWPAERYAALAERAARSLGAAVWVFGDRRERAVTGQVAAGAGGRGVDLGGRTTLRALAAAMARCRVLVTNDTGPMHLAAAVGTPVVAIFGSSDPGRTGPLGVPARVLWRRDLPCVPCLKNRCPRSGPGTILPDAVNECLHLVGVDEAFEAVRALWAARN